MALMMLMLEGLPAPMVMTAKLCSRIAHACVLIAVVSIFFFSRDQDMVKSWVMTIVIVTSHCARHGRSSGANAYRSQSPSPCGPIDTAIRSMVIHINWSLQQHDHAWSWAVQ